jgi:hypothetical protein
MSLVTRTANRSKALSLNASVNRMLSGKPDLKIAGTKKANIKYDHRIFV